ncbi:IclR family transcriptional regulator [Aeribacillus alveayuensis]|uniref:DNA-binding IclR family transcriptional regulator n=1 Tax=Aeribacillus alveayuensis TaxID=279215 RepID=A0ABT9VQB0_9BACI|nr:DNA-binding IclR family transcriptional regulator [Bacillus alveayuensis]
MTSNNRYMLSSVKNALRLLRSFTLEEPEKKVTDLAESLGLGKSTVSRLLSTLESEGFVIKDEETRKYRLGLSILHLNTVLTSHLEITRESQPVLEQLVNEVEETAHVAQLEDMEVIYVNRVECSHPVRILSHIGRRNPLHCTSSGKVLLAFQGEHKVEQYIDQKGLQPYTLKTITDPEKLKMELETIKKQGYAISIEERMEGVTSIAAPIKDYTGKVKYALTVIGPVHRMNPYHPQMIHKVINAAKEISERLGYWRN